MAIKARKASKASKSVTVNAFPMGGEMIDHTAELRTRLQSSVAPSGMRSLSLSSDDFAQERTKATQIEPWPHYYALERKPSVRGKAHQFGPDFGPETCTIIMPSFSLFLETGNPFPNVVNCDGNETSRGYAFLRPLVKLSHAMFDALLSGEQFSAQDVFYEWSDIIDRIENEAAEEMKVKSFSWNRKQFQKNDFAYGILHALRDMEYANGLAQPLANAHSGTIKRDSKTVWRINPALL